MRFGKIGLTVVSLALTGVLASTAMAQAPGGAGGGGGRGQGRGGGGFGQGRGGGFGGTPSLSNLPVPFIAWALTLTDDQKTKIEAIQMKLQTDSRAARQPDASGQRPDRTAMQAKMTELNDGAKKDIEAVLTPAQQKKEASVIQAAEIYNNVRFPLPVVPDLKLTADENAKIAPIAGDAKKARDTAMKAFQDAQAAGNQPDPTTFQTMQTAMTTAHDKAVAVLTDDQKKTLTDYEKAHPQRGFGPGGGGGNGRRPGGAQPGGNPPAL